ncbi:helix-turn-helix transcriptional regulator [Nocardioides sp.]|uniref:helix-turn-helix transcriptional regulator n=1 Tax=Nocardioides sp. TaxID=35761 RepID=UPI003529194F
MRASRLLLMLLLVQNRGRMTAQQLAEELEVSKRTILRDVDALAEAGLPMVVRPGRGGGIELGFNYRTRLTGLAADEAEALGVLLGRPTPELVALGLESAAARARTKIVESLPDSRRRMVRQATARFRLEPEPPDSDERVPALAAAVRRRQVVRIGARDPAPRTVHPTGLVCRATGWHLVDGLTDEEVPVAGCGTINISSHRF